MIIVCNAKCRGVVDASLDVDENKVVCNTCGELIDNVTEFIKLSMKSSGDVIKSRSRKAFVFQCETHNKMTEVLHSNSGLVGKSCPNDKNRCLINITKNMKVAIKEFGDNDEGAREANTDMQSQSE